ncbi:MAG: rod-binding protein [Bdellovibrionales bacterium]
MDKLSPDTTVALLQSHQNDVKAAAKSAQSNKLGIDLEKAEEAAQEFEAVFIAEMMKPMFEGIKHDGTFGGGKGEEIFHGMLVQEYGKLISQTGSVGIADNIKDAMIRMQQEANGMSPLEIAVAEKEAANQTNSDNSTNGESDANSTE